PPRGAAATLPLIALPALFRTGEPDFRFRARAVHAPDLMAVLHVVGRHEPAYAELAAADARDHLVLDDHRRVRNGLAVAIVALLDLPDLLAGVGVERHGVRIQLVEEDLAVRVRDAAVDRVAARDRNHLRVLLRHVLPLYG